MPTFSSPESLAAALRPLLRGQVRSDPFTLSLYSTDASIYEIEPLVVVYPYDEADVRSCLRFGSEHNLPVIARGGGTGLAGEALGRAIVMDMAVHLNRALEVDSSRLLATVQPGLTLGSLNRMLARLGLRFPVDPASGARCTIGGMVANNSSGAHSLKHGEMRRNLSALQLCLMDGSFTWARGIELDGPEHESQKEEPGLSGQVHKRLPGLLLKHAALIAQRRVKAERNRLGYRLDGVIEGPLYDLSKLVCGSEGTLAVVTRAVLKLMPLAREFGLAAVYFDSIAAAARVVPAIRETQPAACELLDGHLMALSRSAAPKLAHLLKPGAGAMLIVEYEGQTPAEIAAQLAELNRALPAGSYQELIPVTDRGEREKLWAAREAATPALYRRQDGLQPTPNVEDAAVPPERLAEYIEKAGRIFEKYKLQWSAYAHAGHGEVHLRPMMDLRRREHLEILEPMAAEVHAAVWECGGTISGEHGEGLIRTQFSERQAGGELYAVFREIKTLFDPAGLLNPDKKISSDPHLMLKNLRFGEDYKFEGGTGFPACGSQAGKPVPPMLNWLDRELADTVERCNGCATCRTTGHELDMCPRYKSTRIEDASPRAKANLLRRMFSGRAGGAQNAGAAGFGSAEFMAVMDYCLNCKSCARDCPAGVNIPKLVMEAKARYHQSHAPTLARWLFMNIEPLARAAMWLRPLANSLGQTPLCRWALELAVGIDRHRPLPLLKRWEWRRSFFPAENSGRAKVALYTDLAAQYFEPEVAQAAIDVLEYHGFVVELPEVPWCNMPALTHGFVPQARAQIERIAAVLAPLANRGIPIITFDSTACLCLRQDFLYFVDTAETRAVARQTVDIFEFLQGLQKDGKLRTDFQRIEAVFGYHQPCHHKALQIGVPGLDLVRLVPGVSVQVLNAGCCGNAGPWGMLKKNYEESLWIGKDLFAALNAPEKKIACGLTECASCKTQMEEGSGKRTLHPVQVLAQAYGYRPAQPRTEALDKLDLPEEYPAHEPVHAP